MLYCSVSSQYASRITDDVSLASGSEAGQEPADTLTSEGDLHSTDTSQMWLSGHSQPGGAWIEFELDRVCKLHQMWVWNYNGAQLNVVYGLKNVTIECSINGTDYTPVGTYEFARATGTNGYLDARSSMLEARRASGIQDREFGRMWSLDGDREGRQPGMMCTLAQVGRP